MGLCEYIHLLCIYMNLTYIWFLSAEFPSVNGPGGASLTGRSIATKKLRKKNHFDSFCIFILYFFIYFSYFFIIFLLPEICFIIHSTTFLQCLGILHYSIYSVHGGNMLDIVYYRSNIAYLGPFFNKYHYTTL